MRERGYLIDLDGTLVSGGRPLPGAAWLLDRLAGRFAIVSNDSEHTAETLSAHLSAIGLAAAPGEIVLAGEAAVEHVAAACPGGCVLLLASPALAGFAEAMGLRVVREGGDAVVVGRDRAFSYGRLAAAAAAVARGAALVVACPDGSHRGPAGEPVPEAGALAAAVLAATGNPPHTVIGKPEPLLFARGCARLGTTPAETVMIGDNPATDGAGARRLGMAVRLVRPGDLGPALFASPLAAA